MYHVHIVVHASCWCENVVTVISTLVSLTLVTSLCWHLRKSSTCLSSFASAFLVLCLRSVVCCLALSCLLIRRVICILRILQCRSISPRMVTHLRSNMILYDSLLSWSCRHCSWVGLLLCCSISCCSRTSALANWRRSSLLWFTTAYVII